MSGAYATDLKIPQKQINNPSCASDIPETIHALHDAGFKGFIISQDVNDPLIAHEMGFDMENNRIIEVLLVYSTEDHKKISKICLVYEGINPDGDGPTFKSFLLRQKITEFNKEQDFIIEQRKKHLLEEHDPHQKQV